MTTNTPTYAAVPELPDADRLAIVQEQIQSLLIESYKLEAAAAALPKKSQQQKTFSAQLGIAQQTLAGYRALEAALIERLISGAS